MSQCPSDMKTRKRQSLTNETRENYKSIVLNNLDTKTIKKILLTWLQQNVWEELYTTTRYDLVQTCKAVLTFEISHYNLPYNSPKKKKSYDNIGW